MKIFYCDACGALVFFENVRCLNCGHSLGFLPDVLDLSALEPEADGGLRALSQPAQGSCYRPCANSLEHQVCNWLVPQKDPQPLCVACRLNEIIPDLSDRENRERWFKLEQAKRRLLYELFQLGLSTEGIAEEQRPSLRFRFLADATGAPVVTGHDQGVITLDIAEADDAERERRRVNLHEPYRTVLGHLRHETGHYYWDCLIGSTPRQEQFRQLFGDERADYAAALRTHYAQGAPPDWQTRHVSAYASAHPWEDWAETWAHYLHMVDTLETATGFGLRLHPRHPQSQRMQAEPEKGADRSATFELVLAQWLPLTYALNSLNRGMGLPDLYPFVLSAPAQEKLRFVHETIQAVSRRSGSEQRAVADERRNA